MIVDVDCILVMEYGWFVEYGIYDELFESGGVYV